MHCMPCEYVTFFFTQVPVEVLGIIFDEEEKSAAVAGDNVKLKLRGIEEEVGCIRADLVYLTLKVCPLSFSKKNMKETRGFSVRDKAHSGQF